MEGARYAVGRLLQDCQIRVLRALYKGRFL